ncbi:nitroreductase family deazaflavin-dependent oxidoreductase [Actinoplanes sp. LDG1-06]|uniref:Nitroreductase family deazaflavin-dependent oxidoreductase n=2 Tax=Paractinoplanes ovalisporus TaxID=2810368 RepID=A0ABS2A960_9ACTN|nr:nitroreductase family deazaflavin-dependent oxidoreductase [Actinoplanes ovalisporus]
MPLDRRLIRLTKGRLSVTGWRTAPPTLLLTTRGRRSGRLRERPLLYARDGDAYIVMGSNWGQAQHPAWSGNLLADPAGQVTVAGETFAVHAALVEGPERDRLWPLLLRVWPAYREYDARSGRELRVFRLTRRSL